MANRTSCSIIKLDTFWHHTTEHRWLRSLFIIRRALKVGDRLPSLRHQHVNSFKVIWSLSESLSVLWPRRSVETNWGWRLSRETREGAETRVGRSEAQGPGAESLTLPGPGNACHIESHRGLGLSASLFRPKGISRISPGVKRERRNTLTGWSQYYTFWSIPHSLPHLQWVLGSIRLPFSAAKYLRVRKGWCIYVTQSRHNTTRQISDASPSLSLPCWQGSPSMLSMQITGVTIQLIW